MLEHLYSQAYTKDKTAYGHTYLGGPERPVKGHGDIAVNAAFQGHLKAINTNEVIDLYNQVWSITGLVIATFITAPFILVLPATAIEEKFGWKPSQTAIYNSLKSMESRSGMISQLKS